MKSFDLYIKTSAIKLFLMVAVPGAVSMVASSLWGIFDSIFVGNFLGDNAFAAMNLAIPFVLINFSLADLIGVGSAVPISIALGKNQNKEANNYFTCACISIVVVGFISGIALYFSAPAILWAMQAEGEVAELGIKYLRTYAVFSPFTTLIFAMDNFLRICGKIKSSMALNITMSAVILVMQYLCICVWKPGIAGSPIAVSSGMIVCAVISLIPFIQKKLTLQFCIPRFSFRIFGQFVSSGSPNFLSNTAARITSILINAVLLRVGGTSAVSVYGILVNIGDIVQQLLYGTCDSLQPAIGYNWGAGYFDRVKRIVKYCLISSAAISLLGMFVMQMFPETFVSLFLGENSEEILSVGVKALRLYCLVNIFRWFPFAIQGFLIALDKPLPATVLSVSNTFAVPILLLVVLYPLGLNGIWLNSAVTALIVSVLAIFILLRMKRRGDFDSNASTESPADKNDMV